MKRANLALDLVVALSLICSPHPCQPALSFLTNSISDHIRIPHSELNLSRAPDIQQGHPIPRSRDHDAKIFNRRTTDLRRVRVERPKPSKPLAFVDFGHLPNRIRSNLRVTKQDELANSRGHTPPDHFRELFFRTAHHSVMDYRSAQGKIGASYRHPTSIAEAYSEARWSSACSY